MLGADVEVRMVADGRVEPRGIAFPSSRRFSHGKSRVGAAPAPPARIGSVWNDINPSETKTDIRASHSRGPRAPDCRGRTRLSGRDLARFGRGAARSFAATLRRTLEPPSVTLHFILEATDPLSWIGVCCVMPISLTVRIVAS